MKILLALAIYSAVITLPFVFMAVREDRRLKRNLQRFLDDPSQIQEVCRENRDGDGYIRLYVQAADGKSVQVAHHDRADKVEKQLALVMKARDSVQVASA